MNPHFLVKSFFFHSSFWFLSFHSRTHYLQPSLPFLPSILSLSWNFSYPAVLLFFHSLFISKTFRDRVLVMRWKKNFPNQLQLITWCRTFLSFNTESEGKSEKGEDCVRKESQSDFFFVLRVHPKPKSNGEKGETSWWSGWGFFFFLFNGR